MAKVANFPSCLTPFVVVAMRNFPLSTHGEGPLILPHCFIFISYTKSCNRTTTFGMFEWCQSMGILWRHSNTWLLLKTDKMSGCKKVGNGPAIFNF